MTFKGNATATGSTCNMKDPEEKRLCRPPAGGASAVSLIVACQQDTWGAGPGCAADLQHMHNERGRYAKLV